MVKHMNVFHTPSLTVLRRSCALVALLAVTALGREAKAMPTFPAEIQAHLELGFTPPCTLCHATPAGGGAVVSKFGQSMLASGLTSDISTLDRALDSLATKKTDSNADGTTDVEQLKEGMDPSTGESLTGVPEQKYGCGARIARGRVDQDSAVAWVALGLAVVLTNRRRSVKRQGPGARSG
jgi:hypothetical protein